MPEPTPTLHRGDILTADFMTSILRRIEALENSHAGGVAEIDRYIAKATSSFAKRSGTTVDAGSIDIYWLASSSGGTGTIATTGISIAEAWCISSTGMTSGQSIDSGQYGTAFRDPFGTWWFSPDECS